MTKVIKEIIIMLLICLISMLILAVALYDYIPNRKVVAEVSTYTTSQEIETQLADDIDSEEKEVVLTYEVTSQDLSSYEVKNEYIPGKSNPFAAATETVDGNSEENTASSGNNTESNTTGNTTQTTPPDENKIETNAKKLKVKKKTKIFI